MNQIVPITHKGKKVGEATVNMNFDIVNENHEINAVFNEDGNKILRDLQNRVVFISSRQIGIVSEKNIVKSTEYIEFELKIEQP